MAATRIKRIQQPGLSAAASQTCETLALLVIGSPTRSKFALPPLAPIARAGRPSRVPILKSGLILMACASNAASRSIDQAAIKQMHTESAPVVHHSKIG